MSFHFLKNTIQNTLWIFIIKKSIFLHSLNFLSFPLLFHKCCIVIPFIAITCINLRGISATRALMVLYETFSHTFKIVCFNSSIDWCLCWSILLFIIAHIWWPPWKNLNFKAGHGIKNILFYMWPCVVLLKVSLIESIDWIFIINFINNVKLIVLHWNIFAFHYNNPFKKELSLHIRLFVCIISYE